jgi:hypothetical protein
MGATLLGIALCLPACAAHDSHVDETAEPPASAASDTGDAGATQAAIPMGLHDSPVYFIENRGQAGSEASHYIQGRGTTLYFTPQGVMFVLAGPAAPPDAGKPETLARETWAVALDFVGARADVVPEGREPTGAIVSYFRGPPEQWQTGLATFSTLVYPDLWPGIDLVYSGMASKLKTTFHVRPGADPGQIRLAYRGAGSVRLTGGRLAVATPVGGFEDDAPEAFQETPDGRVLVESAYALEVVESVHALDADGAVVYGFHLGAYDSGKALVIDPAVLVYSGFIGGSGSDGGEDIAVDWAGNAYVTGDTSSAADTFPVKVGPDRRLEGTDAFVAKIDADGDLVYAGYLGGSGYDIGRGIAVDVAGNAYVTGWTTSDESTFPVKIGPGRKYSGNTDAFVAKVNASGRRLDYAGYIGGSAVDLGFAVAVDWAGQAYVTGRADSDESTFPVRRGPDLTQNGNADGFVAKVVASGARLDYAGYIGGVGQDEGFSVAVDWVGRAYVTGWTNSNEISFPVRIGPDLTHNGGFDAFVARVQPPGDRLSYAGYLGGAGNDVGQGIAVDLHGQAHVAGNTASNESTFPVKGGPDITFNGVEDAFIAKVRPTGADLVYAGYLGGSSNDGGTGIAVDLAGNAYVTGATASSEATFPIRGGPTLHYQGGYDAFVTQVRPSGRSGATFGYSGYIGGDSTDDGRAIAVDLLGDVYVVGYTYSTEGTFPVKGGPSVIHSGGSDAFVAKISQSPAGGL